MPGTKDAMVTALRDFEAARPEECELIPSEDQFYGFSRGANRLAHSTARWVACSQPSRGCTLASDGLAQGAAQGLAAGEARNSALGKLACTEPSGQRRTSTRRSKRCARRCSNNIRNSSTVTSTRSMIFRRRSSRVSLSGRTLMRACAFNGNKILRNRCVSKSPGPTFLPAKVLPRQRSTLVSGTSIVPACAANALGPGAVAQPILACEQILDVHRHRPALPTVNTSAEVAGRSCSTMAITCAGADSKMYRMILAGY